MGNINVSGAPAGSAGAERAALQAECASLAQAELAKLDARLAQLRQMLAVESAPGARLVLVAAMDDLDRAGAAWRALQAFVDDPGVSDDQAFTESMALCGYAIRRGAAARSALMRHTPAVRGTPAGLDPDQAAQAQGRGYTVDYLRGGYILYQTPEQQPPSRYADHPLLARAAAGVLATVYPQCRAATLAFTCGIAALDAVMDVMAGRSLKNGRRNYLGQNCWIELRRRMEGRDPRAFALYDDADPAACAALLLHPEVQSVWIEGIQNHPDMRVADQEALLRAARALPPGADKYLVVDNIATFDSDVLAAFSAPDVRGRVSLVCALSMIKFFQNGSDSAKTGLLVLDLNEGAGNLYTELIEARAGSGKAPAYEEIFAAGSDTVPSLRGRMQRYDRNTQLLARRLAALADDGRMIAVSSPWLPAHPDHQRALSLHGHGGRFVYVRLAGSASGDELGALALYRALADGAAAAGVPLIAASSFGFAIPHLHIVRHQGRGLSLRLSLGSVHLALAERTADYLCAVIAARLPAAAPALPMEEAQ